MYSNPIGGSGCGELTGAIERRQNHINALMLETYRESTGPNTLESDLKKAKQVIKDILVTYH